LVIGILQPTAFMADRDPLQGHCISVFSPLLIYIVFMDNSSTYGNRIPPPALPYCLWQSMVPILLARIFYAGYSSTSVQGYLSHTQPTAVQHPHSTKYYPFPDEPTVIGVLTRASLQ